MAAMPHSHFDDDESFLDTRPDPVPMKRRPGPELWVVHMSHHKIGAARGLAEGFISVGWLEAGDLRRYPTQEKMKAAFAKLYPEDKLETFAQWAGDALRFLSMNKGDLFVFPPKSKNEIHIGEITGDYEFAEHDAELVKDDAAQIRRVKWLKTVSREAFSQATLSRIDRPHTVHSGKDYRDEVVAILGSTPRPPC